MNAERLRLRQRQRQNMVAKGFSGGRQTYGET